MSYNKELHAYDVEVTKSYTVIFKVIAHSEEQARNEAWDYAQQYDFSEIESDPIEVNYVDDNGKATEEEYNIADVITEEE